MDGVVTLLIIAYSVGIFVIGRRHYALGAESTTPDTLFPWPVIRHNKDQPTLFWLWALLLI
jgi:hypothetical protein